MNNDVKPLTADDILEFAVAGTTLPLDRVLATFAEPSNWVQIFDGMTLPSAGYRPKPCEWAFVGPFRPPFELAQIALRNPHRGASTPALIAAVDALPKLATTKTVAYFVDGEQFSSELSTISGSMLRLALPDTKRHYALYLEGGSDQPDLPVEDDHQFSLVRGIKFYTVPPANFGQQPVIGI